MRCRSPPCFYSGYIFFQNRPLGIIQVARITIAHGLPSFITLILTSVYPFKTRSQPLTTVGTKFNVFSFINNLSESRFWAYFLVLPSFVLVSAVILYPIVSGILLSFRQMRLNRPTLGTGYIGLEHYSTLLQDAVFKQAVINTVVWVGVGVASQFLLGLLTALALSRPMRGMRLARVFVLIPWILPTVVAGNIWALMLDARLVLQPELRKHGRQRIIVT
jgi:ABC-type polysaccharide transport system permease subunit